MSWGWLISLAMKLLGLFGGSKGTRITFEARPESSMEAERKRLERLRDDGREKHKALDEVTVELAKHHTVDLDNKRQQLYAEYHQLRRDYLNAGGRASDIE